jgi:hypothetical protein
MVSIDYKLLSLPFLPKKMFTKLKNLHTHTDFIFNDILANPYHKASRIENQTDHRLPFSNIRMPFFESLLTATTYNGCS